MALLMAKDYSLPTINRVRLTDGKIASLPTRSEQVLLLRFSAPTRVSTTTSARLLQTSSMLLLPPLRLNLWVLL